MRRSHRLGVTCALAVVAALSAWPAMAAASAPPATVWTVDPAHTRVGFAVNHFFTPVEGRFTDFTVTLAYDPQNPASSRVTAKIPVASVDTGNRMRDDDLRSASWFAADRYPVLSFESDSVRALDEHHLLATGTLSIKGRSRQVTLPIEILGVQPIPEPMQKMMMGAREVASFRATLPLDRHDFEVGVGNWASDMVVGKTVDIALLVEAHR